MSAALNPVIIWSFAVAGGFLPLFVGVVLPKLLGGWKDNRSKLFAGLSLGILLSSFYDLMKETSGLSSSTLKTGLDAVNVLALSLVLLGFCRLHSRVGGESPAPLALVYLWTLLGVGFHGFGEGIIAGYDFASGFTILSLPQALSFALHKIGEGFTIGTLLSIAKKKIPHHISASVLGGSPVAIGTVLGIVGLPAGTSTVFFAAAVGATTFLVFRFGLLLGRERSLPVLGIFLGFIYMYLSGVLHQFE